MTGTELRLALAACCAATLVGSGTALAASLVLTPEKLTVFAQCVLRSTNIDSYVDQGSATNNFGTASDIYVRSKSGSANARAFIRFDLTPCPLSSTASVQTATLSLFMTAAPPTSRTYETHRVTATWGETTITWNNAPAVAGSATSSTTTGTTPSVRREWEVAGDVQLFAGGTANYGWRIKDVTEGSSASPEAKFAPREWGTASERPKLTISYYP